MKWNSLRSTFVVAILFTAAAGHTQTIRTAIPAQQRPAENGLLRAGQLAKAGTHLSRAFLEYRTHVDQGRTTEFRPSNQLLSFSDGFVLVDVRASASGDTLLTDLVQLGLTRGARAGEIVSGLLPIAALGDAVALSSLRSIVAL